LSTKELTKSQSSDTKSQRIITARIETGNYSLLKEARSNYGMPIGISWNYMTHKTDRGIGGKLDIKRAILNVYSRLKIHIRANSKKRISYGSRDGVSANRTLSCRSLILYSRFDPLFRVGARSTRYPSASSFIVWLTRRCCYALISSVQ